MNSICGLFRVDAVVSENREQQRVLLWRLLRPRSREGESARGFEASSAVTGCFLLRAVFVEAVKMRRTGERETK